MQGLDGGGECDGTDEAAAGAKLVQYRAKPRMVSGGEGRDDAGALRRQFVEEQAAHPREGGVRTTERRTPDGVVPGRGAMADPRRERLQQARFRKRLAQRLDETTRQQPATAVGFEIGGQGDRRSAVAQRALTGQPRIALAIGQGDIQHQQRIAMGGA